MKQYGYTIRAFLITALLVIHSAETAGADKPIGYYKSGDVGAFSVDIEVPANIDVNTTAFTARASNKKLYLLNVESSESVAESLTQAMFPSQRLALSRENLWAIGKACLIYANDHDDKYPPNLQELVEKKYLFAQTP